MLLRNMHNIEIYAALLPFLALMSLYNWEAHG